MARSVTIMLRLGIIVSAMAMLFALLGSVRA